MHPHSQALHICTYILHTHTTHRAIFKLVDNSFNIKLLELRVKISRFLPHTHVYIDAIDFDLLVDTLRKLKESKHVEVPIYDFNTHSRAKYTVG